jgi:hypothetical protein
MLCNIADLLIEIPEGGGLTSRCGDYQTQENVSADIVLRADKYNFNTWGHLPYEQAVYMASGTQFYGKLLGFDGLMLHASAVALDGKAYLFSGPCGMGKSTHTGLWQELFGDRAKVFNDDKPALRCIDGKWYAYGTPWCGKNGININMKVPLGGICFLKRGEENAIRRLDGLEAVANLMSQTLRKFKDVKKIDLMLGLVDRLVREIPIYELTNKPELDAARLSYETMHRGAEEANL